MIVHHYYYRDSRLRRYAEGLAAVGVQVDVLCLRDPNQTSAGDVPGIRILTLPLARSTGGIGRYLFHYMASFILFSVWLSILAWRRRYQVVHVHNMPDSLVFTALVPHLLGAKVILDIHDPMPEFYMSKVAASQKSVAVRLARLQEQLSARVADAVITANANFKCNLVARGTAADEITVINNLPDPQVFIRQARSRLTAPRKVGFTLIYPGTIAPRYGLEVAINALPPLLKHIPDLRLLVIGGVQPAYLDHLRILAITLGVNQVVDIRPPVPVDQVPGMMAQADIGIYPALSDPHMDIATPTKVLEYAIMGLPIVASRLPILEGLFGQHAIRFHEPGNSAELAACILDLYRQPEERQAMVDRADAVFTRNNSWHREQQRYFRLLDQLLSASGQGSRLRSLAASLDVEPDKASGLLAEKHEKL